MFFNNDFQCDLKIKSEFAYSVAECLVSMD